MGTSVKCLYYGCTHCNHQKVGGTKESDLPSGKCLQFAMENGNRNRVSFPIEKGDFPVRNVNVYQRVPTPETGWSVGHGT